MKIKCLIGLIAAVSAPLMQLSPWTDRGPVDQVPSYVVDCEDTEDGYGPCVMLDDPTGYNQIWYVPSGSSYPDNAVELSRCDTEDGSGDRSACAWIPWMMGEEPSDGRIIVYGV